MDILAGLSHAQAVLGSIGASGILASLAIVVELVMRLVPSEKPLSLAYVAADGLHALGKVSDAAGAILDKVLPQRVK